MSSQFTPRQPKIPHFTVQISLGTINVALKCQMHFGGSQVGKANKYIFLSNHISEIRPERLKIVTF